ncbi:MAG: hypothetical protein A4S17_07455 [Proteobacteria bacterium HN_bin10]|nr:MAG: hypothetical protein A4S17_07455 [Proteobacteria bacterium HN_bin10]
MPRRAHLAHAAVMGLHALCCGLPALLVIVAASAASSVTLMSDFVAEFHDFMHRHEIWILVVSAALVGIGGWLEANARRRAGGGFPWLFAFSVLCFAINLAIIAGHRTLLGSI